MNSITTSTRIAIPIDFSISAQVMEFDFVNYSNESFSEYGIYSIEFQPARTTKPIEKWRFVTNGAVWAPAIAYDLNNDGLKEVLVGSTIIGGTGNDRNFYVLSSNGTLLWNFTTEKPTPVWLEGGITTMATIADVNNDNRLEVLFGTDGGILYCLDALTGNLVWRYRDSGTQNNTDISIDGSPAVAKLPDDTSVVVFGQCVARWNENDPYNGLYALNGDDGTLLWNFTTEYGVCSSPAIADVDNDGEQEVVFGSNEDIVRSLDLRTGHLEWATLLRGGNSVIWTNPFLMDTDNDGVIEIYVLTMAGNLYVLDGVTGEKTLLGIFSDSNASPVVADLDGDNRMELVVAWYYGTLYLLDVNTGIQLWNSLLDKGIDVAPAIADIDLSGSLDIIVATEWTDASLYAFDSSGRTRWSVPLNEVFSSSPLVTDLDNDGNQDIVVGSGSEVLCYTVESISTFAYAWPWIGERGGAGTGATGNWTDHDGDRLTDTYELAAGSDPELNDTDSDGLTDYQEFAHSTNPWTNDTDGDGLPESWELENGYNPLDPTDAAEDYDFDNLTVLEEYKAGSNPHATDTDKDGIPDGEEVHTYGTDPTSNDTDSDGMPDNWELTFGFDPLKDDAAEDIDNDGLSNLDEYLAGTNPLTPDSDSDGFYDGWEVANGFDPLDPVVPFNERLLSVAPSLLGFGAAVITLVLFANYKLRKKNRNFIQQTRSD